MSEDEKHLDLLATFHYIVGGLTALFACFPLIHVAVGVAFILGDFGHPGGKTPPPPPFIGWIFVIMGSTFILLGWTLAIAMLIAGRKLRRRTAYMYCLVVAGIECIFMPFGTVLGVLTIIVLVKDSVKQLFAAGNRPRATENYVNRVEY